MSVFFEHVGPADRIRKALNVLAEAPFFYRRDDPDLFAFLRRNRAEFERFYRDLFGWQMVVDPNCARLVKEVWHNRALRPSQHDVFQITRRDDCIAFLLILEFHEHLLEEHNASIDDPEPLRFHFGQLFDFACDRFRAVLGDGAPSAEEVRKILRGLFPTLLRFRFLAEIEPEVGERTEIDRENLIYECLPGLYLYDVRALGPLALGRFAADRSSSEPEEEQAS